MQVKNLTPTIGAEVSNVDLADASDELLANIKQVLGERAVLVFRDQHLTRDQHKQIGRAFGTGELHRHALAGKGSDDPEILAVRTDEKSRYTAGDGWHTDVSCDPDPIACSMLYITEVPASGGGDTLFANMAQAYQTLSDPVKALIRGLTAIHDGALPYKNAYGIEPPVDKPYNRTRHPIVIKHPVTGKEILWVNRGFTSGIKGVSPLESAHLLEMLFHHIEATPRLQCRVQWEPNTLVMWDNVATQHHAVWDYFPESRYGERVSAKGVELQAA